jgi:hypothetical protein
MAELLEKSIREEDEKEMENDRRAELESLKNKPACRKHVVVEIMPRRKAAMNKDL